MINDTLQCPGRLSATGFDRSLVQEYVIYDCHQALPLDLIEYSVHRVDENSNGNNAGSSGTAEEDRICNNNNEVHGDNEMGMSENESSKTSVNC